MPLFILFVSTNEMLLGTTMTLGLLLALDSLRSSHLLDRLTKTEFISSAVDGVYFTGVLDVEAKHVCKWLSIQGLATVQGDLERRAVSNGKQPFRLENLDDPVFGSELIVKVLILCKKTLTATFLTSRFFRAIFCLY